MVMSLAVSRVDTFRGLTWVVDPGLRSTMREVIASRRTHSNTSYHHIWGSYDLNRKEHFSRFLFALRMSST